MSEYAPLTRTNSPFWLQDDVTRLIRDSRVDDQSRGQLAELVYRPAIRRLDDWFRASHLNTLNIEFDEVFDQLWEGDLRTTISNVDFNDRKHFLNTVLMRIRQAAMGLAAKQRREWDREDALRNDAVGAPCQLSHDAVETLELLERVLAEIDRMAEADKSILLLKIIEGMTFSQIASECGIPQSTAHYRFDAAQKKLQQRLQ